MRGIAENSFNDIGWSIANQINATLGYWDTNQVCRYANKAYVEWFGKTPEEMIDKMTIRDLLGSMYELNQPYITGALKGEKQVFERRIILPGGELRDSIITYMPDIKENEVRGFFVHIVDVTLTKSQEAEILAAARAKDKEVLRSTIETYEKERESVAEALRDSVNQTFAYSKMMLQAATFKDSENEELKKIEKNIQVAINELNVISDNLSISAITLFGLEISIEDYIIPYRNQYDHKVQFILKGECVESLSLEDQISIFRMIQNFLQLMSLVPERRTIVIKLSCLSSSISLILAHNDMLFKMPEESLNYINIQNRVSFYDGSLNENCENGQYKMEIELDLATIKKMAVSHGKAV